MICPKCQLLLFYLQEEMGRKECAFWGSTEAEWIEIVERRRYDGNRIIGAAFLLWFLNRSATSQTAAGLFVSGTASLRVQGCRGGGGRSRLECTTWVTAPARCGGANHPGPLRLQKGSGTAMKAWIPLLGL